jgi:hypothetical protein
MNSVLFLALLAVLSGQRITMTGGKDRYDSLRTAYLSSLRNITSPELERRNAARRRVQKLGYVGTQQAMYFGGGLDALLPYIKMELHLTFFLPHDQIYVYFRPASPPAGEKPAVPGFLTFGNAPIAIPLYEDWTFPENLWEHPDH